ncbi:DegV family protein [Clostridium luticellarii]|jgi:DegV family protein with EDD domain|uniref:DegV family protein n=1 Tax=Clostridium luticellarii TaxID=1691940 RepID=UPI002357F265|nr:DegV family protein [Clostridium luticellarii]MCI1945633.1 DegV family protein [Clostridium luticellarii]MCI1968450.1 DegV family protein [Clostridium luticellarii]MCI1996533.1 DegV family protein [Clostridium luticellarii]MCI2039844.1 DegV family protein [Clostridium luticellarii]
MEKIALLTDSACDIDDETVKKYNIEILPFRIIYKHREYIDKLQITPKEVYDNMKVEIPKSSLPSIDDMENVFNKLENENYTHIIAVTISSGLSGTYNALKMVSGRHEKLSTYVYDSKSTSLGEGIILKECGKLIDRGKSFKEIVHCIPEIKKRMHFFFVFGTLEYARKGGRIGAISGIIGEALDIKPIVYFDDNQGICFTCGKVRGRKRSLNKMIDIGREFLSKSPCDVYIAHGNAREDAESIYRRISILPNVKNTYMIGQISPIVGVYSGPGTVGICYMEIESS